MMGEGASTAFAAHGLDIKGTANISGPLVFEKPVSLWNGVSVNSCSIGAYSYLAPGASALLATIGRYCSIGDGVRIGATRHPMERLTTSPFPYKPLFGHHVAYRPPDEWNELETVQVGHDVWIGSGAFILSGVSVGHGAVIAARAVVTKHVPPYAVVAGVPGRSIKRRFPDELCERLMSLHWWDYDWPAWLGQGGHWPCGELNSATLDALARLISEGQVPRITEPARTLRRTAKGWSLT